MKKSFTDSKSGITASSNGSKAGNDFVAQMQRTHEEHLKAMMGWVEYLKSFDIKAAHADDGWVDREKNKIVFSYPDFILPIEVGDHIAIGTPEKWRIVRVIRKEPWKFSLSLDNRPNDYYFEPAPEHPASMPQTFEGEALLILRKKIVNSRRLLNFDFFVELFNGKFKR